MKHLIIICSALVSITLFSCKKRDDKTLTKVGFYLDDNKMINSEVTPYKLFIDDEYKGEIYALDYVPNESDTKVLYYTLDSKKHDIDLKNDKGEYLSTGYLQIEKNSFRSGSCKDQKKVVEGINGSSVSKKTENQYALYAFMKNRD